MIRNRLAEGLQVSPLGLGTVKFGRNQGVKYPASFELPSDQDILNLLSEAAELGINLLDTAPAYGLSESRIGRLLMDRTRWVLGTKVGESFENQQSTFDFSYSGVEASLNRSLTRLRTDYLDYCLLHSDGRDIEVLQAGGLKALRDAKQAGKVRAVGISSKTVEGAKQAVDLGLDIIMVALSPEDTQELEAAQYAVAQGVGVMVKKAMGSGHLNPQTSLRTVASFDCVSCIVSGTLNLSHLRENARIVREVTHA